MNKVIKHQRGSGLPIEGKMMIQFYTWNEIKQMMLLRIMNKLDKWSFILHRKYDQLAFEDTINVSLQNRPDFIDPPKK